MSTDLSYSSSISQLPANAKVLPESTDAGQNPVVTADIYRENKEFTPAPSDPITSQSLVKLNTKLLLHCLQRYRIINHNYVMIK